LDTKYGKFEVILVGWFVSSVEELIQQHPTWSQGWLLEGQQKRCPVFVCAIWVAELHIFKVVSFASL